MDDPYLAKLASTIRHLYHATEGHKLTWYISEHNSELFETRIADRRVTIGEVSYMDEDGDPIRDIEVSVYDSDGRRIESIRDTKLSGVSLGIPGFSGWYAFMNSIFETARRRVDGSEEAIDDILAALKSE